MLLAARERELRLLQIREIGERADPADHASVGVGLRNDLHEHLQRRPVAVPDLLLGPELGRSRDHAAPGLVGDGLGLIRDQVEPASTERLAARNPGELGQAPIHVDELTLGVEPVDRDGCGRRQGLIAMLALEERGVRATRLALVATDDQHRALAAELDRGGRDRELERAAVRGDQPHARPERRVPGLSHAGEQRTGPLAVADIDEVEHRTAFEPAARSRAEKALGRGVRVGDREIDGDRDQVRALGRESEQTRRVELERAGCGASTQALEHPRILPWPRALAS